MSSEETARVLMSMPVSGSHKEVVQLPLEKGADINERDREYDGNALPAASSQGNKEVVQPPLEKGAGVNTQGGLFGNALHATSSKGGFRSQ
ncbi:hypothetical protein EYZ11_012722 [Aspergillus tanneri]|uniref:Uncharacterized protein n=1 Tax=Aspergillus tanneri TaxID=1220188 RepID=A0A4S3IZS6_9EURO|nr:hypothetical protein EYZ11_012722 [Aspergillus tanneri]